MSDEYPRLFADDQGVWREDTPGHPSGIEWGEIDRVSGHKLDAVTQVHTCVVLDFEYGEFIEMYDTWPGFGQVVAALTEKLPGIPDDWFERIQQLDAFGPSVESIDVWQRQ
jgi:hypothetical protein